MLLVLFALLPAFALVLSTAREHRQGVISAAEGEALRLARLIAGEQEAILDGARQLFASLGKLPAVREQDAGACSALFAPLVKEFPFYINIGAATPDGDVFCSAVPETGDVNVADRPYFRRALQTRGLVRSEFLIGRITGKATLMLASPVQDQRGAVKAVLLVGLSLDWMTRTVAHTKLPERATVTVHDRTGVVLARSLDPAKWIGKPVPEARLRAILAQGEGVLETEGLDGVERIYGFVPLFRVGEGAPGAFVVVGLPKDATVARANRILVRDLTILGLVTVGVILLAWIGSNAFVLRQINRLVDATGHIAAGDFWARTGMGNGDGELHRLARAFDHMAATLEARSEELRRVDRVRRVLRESSRALIQAQGESRLLREFCRLLVEVGGYALVWVGIAERDAEASVRVVARTGRGADDLDAVGRAWSESELGRGATGQALQTGQTVIVRDMATDPDYDPWRDWALRHDLGSTIALPLLLEGSPFGVLRVYATERDAFGAEEAALLEEVAADAAYGITALGAHAGRSLAMASLGKSEERYRHLVEASIEGIVIHRDLRVLFANRAAGQILGFDRADQLLGQDLRDLADPSERDRVAGYSQARLRGERAPPQFEVQARRRDGTPIWLEVLSAVVAWEDRPAILTTMIDITARKRAEAEAERHREARHAAERLAALGRLAAGIGHELRNPTTVIDARARLLRKQLNDGQPPSPDVLDRYVASLEDAADRMKRILQALSTYAKPSKPEPTRVDMSELAAAAAELLAYDARKVNVTVAVEAPRPAWVVGDRTQLMQVLVNLATNAVQAMEATGGRLILRALAEEHGATVRVEVADSGPGIPPEVIAKLGEPFFTTKPEGTGLGLSIVRGIVAEHPGAHLSIASEPGHGATFTIAMPAAPEAPETSYYSDSL